MELADDRSLCVTESLKHALHKFAILNARGGITFANVRSFQGGTGSFHMSEFLGHPATDHFMDDNPPTDDGEVCIERRVTTKPAQNLRIVGEQCQKNVRGQIVNVVRRKRNTASVSGVLNHLDEQSGEAVDKRFPTARIAVQTAGDQYSVFFE